jgi:hypothetical protein
MLFSMANRMVNHFHAVLIERFNFDWALTNGNQAAEDPDYIPPPPAVSPIKQRDSDESAPTAQARHTPPATSR